MTSRHIFHLVAQGSLRSRYDGQVYSYPGVEDGGYVPCAKRSQVARVAMECFERGKELLLLTINPARLPLVVAWEDPGCGEHFPHVYGEIPRGAIVNIRGWPVPM